MYSMEYKLFGLNFRLEVVVICLVVGLILGAHLFCSCTTVNLKEGMQMLGSAPTDWSMGTGVSGSWTNKAEQYAKDMGYQDNLKKYQSYVGTPVPLPPGQLFMFADNKFKPECCPTTYTSSTGCSCISEEQVKYINERGGNRTIAPSEF